MNRALRSRVTPRPEDAILQPEATCKPPPSNAPPPLCEFGVPSDQATATILLIGDSHATHWRPALAVVAQALRWHVISLTRPSCPFTTATTIEPGPKPRECTQWNGQVVQFARDHPEIATVVVSEDHEPIVVPRGSTLAATEIDGFTAAWHALPDSVQHLLVIRDDPYDRLQTPDCVDRARRRHQDIGRRCAIPRHESLKTDYAVTAARREHARDPASRVLVTDLTPFFCGRRLCLPVVGGVLVHRDGTHLSLLYARTLGPYLLRSFERLLHIQPPDG